MPQTFLGRMVHGNTPLEDLLENLEMSGASGRTQTVERLKPSVARHMLGVRQCLAGTNDLEIDYLTKIAVT